MVTSFGGRRGAARSAAQTRIDPTERVLSASMHRPDSLRWAPRVTGRSPQGAVAALGAQARPWAADGLASGASVVFPRATGPVGRAPLQRCAAGCDAGHLNHHLSTKSIIKYTSSGFFTNKCVWRAREMPAVLVGDVRGGEGVARGVSAKRARFVARSRMCVRRFSLMVIDGLGDTHATLTRHRCHP